MLCRSCCHIPLVVQRYSTRFHVKSLKRHPKNNGRSVHVKPAHCVIKLLPSSPSSERENGEEIPHLLKQPLKRQHVGKLDLVWDSRCVTPCCGLCGTEHISGLFQNAGTSSSAI